MNRIDLAGRRAVITGGAQGIGRAIAERFLESGASVSVWDRNQAATDSTVQELSGHGLIHGLVVDVTDAQRVGEAAAETAKELGGIDILVANAGITGPNTECWNYPPDAWRQVIDINLTGIFLCCRAVVPHMIQQKYGRIVNVASIAGKEGNPNASAYSAAKAGVIALTKSIAKEVAGTGVLVNCIAPAVIDTPILGQLSEEHIGYMLQKIPLGRVGKPEEVAHLIAYLASEDLSFATGACFDISGGRAVY